MHASATSELPDPSSIPGQVIMCKELAESRREGGRARSTARNAGFRCAAMSEKVGQAAHRFTAAHQDIKSASPNRLRSEPLAWRETHTNPHLPLPQALDLAAHTHAAGSHSLSRTPCIGSGDRRSWAASHHAGKTDGLRCRAAHLRRARPPDGCRPGTCCCSGWEAHGDLRALLPICAGAAQRQRRGGAAMAGAAAPMDKLSEER